MWDLFDIFLANLLSQISKYPADVQYQWCPGGDSNPHTSRHMNLNHACLPIPPPGQVIEGGRNKLISISRSRKNAAAGLLGLDCGFSRELMSFAQDSAPNLGLPISAPEGSLREFELDRSKSFRLTLSITPLFHSCVLQVSAIASVPLLVSLRRTPTPRGT